MGNSPDSELDAVATPETSSQEDKPSPVTAPVPPRPGESPDGNWDPEPSYYPEIGTEEDWSPHDTRPPTN